MITGTNAYCKVLNVSVSEITATVTLLIFATKATTPAKSFRICIKDIDTDEISYADNNVYWVDQVHNYNFDSNNVDTKKHKEIMLSVDISRENTSDIKENRWIRNCYIYLVDSTKDINDVPAWSSDALSLVSDEFEIPIIKNISFDTIQTTSNRGQIKTKFTLGYSSEKDFNYDNDNFSAFLKIRSVATDNVLETKQIATSSVSLYNEITTTQDYKYGDEVVVQLLITNKNGFIIRDERKIYKPVKKYTNTFIKTDNGIKRVITFFVNTDGDKEHEGEWLPSTGGTLHVVKSNYNNAYVKIPKRIVPSFFIFALPDFDNEGEKKFYIEIENKLDEEPYYDDYNFEIYLNDILVSYATKQGGNIVEIDTSYYEDNLGLDGETTQLTVTIKGYYKKNNIKVYEFDPRIESAELTPIISEEIVCSDILYVDDIVQI